MVIHCIIRQTRNEPGGYQLDKQVLKTILEGIKDNDFMLPQDFSHYELVIEMMNYIGDIDDKLRDELILSILSNWILEDKLSKKEMKNLFEITLDEEHVLKGLGREDDSVFTRTFSAEIIAVIIYQHRKESFLSELEINKAFCTVLRFYNEDKDVRGYIEGKGWAHGAAHGADALDEFARCKEFGYKELSSILTAISNKVKIHHYGYIYFEDERMITVVNAILEREIIPLTEWMEWVRSFTKIERLGKYPEDLVIEFNINTFLKSLYFRLLDIPGQEQITELLKEVIKQINRFCKC